MQLEAVAARLRKGFGEASPFRRGRSRVVTSGAPMPGRSRAPIRKKIRCGRAATVVVSYDAHE